MLLVFRYLRICEIGLNKHDLSPTFGGCLNTLIQFHFGGCGGEGHLVLKCLQNIIWTQYSAKLLEHGLPVDFLKGHNALEAWCNAER